MRRPIDETHDPALRSWVASANEEGCDFPIQNLPFGVFRPASGGAARIGVAIGDKVVDMHTVALAELIAPGLRDACSAGTLNSLMARGPEASGALRKRLSELLSESNDELSSLDGALLDLEDVSMLLPASVGDYTDFYASLYHATNVGSMFRPDNPLLPNYKHIPVGYHGRASTLHVSGANVTRPMGQTKADDSEIPTFGPCRLLDYELEMGFFVGRSNDSEAIPIGNAEGHIFGMCLVNDWSARDIQKWEYVPLGPFLAKSFATTLSPWVITMEALAPFRIASFERDAEDPQPLDYLSDPEDRELGGVGVSLEVYISSLQMREKGIEEMRLSHASFDSMYWTIAQMLTHHSSNGCEMRSGDLLASGTVSGPNKENRGSMLELSWRGTEPIALTTGEERRFLADGDELILRGYCEREGRVRIGFGECRGTVLPARTMGA